MTKSSVLPVSIRLYEGPREALAALFSEADDSEEQIASYRHLGEVLIAAEGERPVAHALLVDTAEPNVVELKSLAVEQRFRSQGIGSMLVGAAIDHCRARGAKKLVVATAAASIGALQFYQRLGFRISHVIRDFYVAGRGYRPLDINGIPLLDEVILDLDL